MRMTCRSLSKNIILMKKLKRFQGNTNTCVVKTTWFMRHTFPWEKQSCATPFVPSQKERMPLHYIQICKDYNTWENLPSGWHLHDLGQPIWFGPWAGIIVPSQHPYSNWVHIKRRRSVVDKFGGIAGRNMFVFSMSWR